MTHPQQQTPPARLAVVVKGYPRLSETFIAQELLALQQRGIVFDIWSLRHPTDTRRHALNDRITAPVHYLPEYLHQEPLRVLRSLFRLPLPSLVRTAGIWLRDWLRDRTANRGRRFGQAIVLAAELPADVGFLYAHFLHTPASVARYAAQIRGLGWGFSAHARDIWTSPDWEKAEKLADAAFGVTCTAVGVEHLRGLSATPERMRLLYHGLDLSRFPDPPARPERTGLTAEQAVRIVSVGRLVEKKGYDLLLPALAQLPPALHWRLIHIGGGPLADEMRQRAESLGIADRIDWRGSADQATVIETLRDGDLFALTSRIAADGDRDGLPNVLMEAASQGLPLLATAVAAIPEFLRDGVEGLLVAPEPAAIATGLTRLLSDATLRRTMGDAACQRVRSTFGMDSGITTLEQLLRQNLTTSTPQEAVS